jgi:hypothetical protein
MGENWRAMLVDYLAGIITLQEFYKVFVTETWDCEYDDVSGSIALTMAEYTGGHRTEDDIIRIFRDLMK